METAPPLHDATGALLGNVPVRTLNAIAEASDFEMPISGDDLAFAQADVDGIDL